MAVGMLPGVGGFLDLLTGQGVRASCPSPEIVETEPHTATVVQPLVTTTGFRPTAGQAFAVARRILEDGRRELDAHGHPEIEATFLDEAEMYRVVLDVLNAIGVTPDQNKAVVIDNKTLVAGMAAVHQVPQRILDDLDVPDAERRLYVVNCSEVVQIKTLEGIAADLGRGFVNNVNRSRLSYHR